MLSPTRSNPRGYNLLNCDTWMLLVPLHFAVPVLFMFVLTFILSFGPQLYQEKKTTTNVIQQLLECLQLWAFLYKSKTSTVLLILVINFTFLNFTKSNIQLVLSIILKDKPLLNVLMEPQNL